MKRQESTRERIERINKEFDDMLAGTDTGNNFTTPEEIANRFGLTLSQAKSWLKKEPNYTNRRIFTEEKDRRGLDRTLETHL